MSRRSALAISRAPLAAMAGIGVFWGSFAAMVPALKSAMDLSDAGMGGLLFLAAAGAIGAMALAPRLEAARPATAMPLTGAAMAVAVLLLGLSQGLGALPLAALALIGVGMSTGALDILANTRVSGLESREERALMSLNHAGYSFAYAIAAAVTGPVREAGWPPALWFAVVAASALALVPVMALDRPGARGANGSPDGAAAARRPVARAAVVAGLVVLVAFFAENATEGWSALHIERTLGHGAAMGALGPALLGFTMGVGRLLGHRITAFGAETRVIRIGAGLSAAGLALAAAAPTVGLAYLGFAALGLGVSVVAPLALAIAGRSASGVADRARAVSRAAMIGYTGFFVGPPLMGVLSDLFGLRAAFALAAATLALVPLVLVPALGVRPSRRKSSSEPGGCAARDR
ncbi:MFS transporter [Rhodobacterales bacterium HKCCE2091]|nr:MFS transporter [Rhodobacterales bacterium HKCCE2091]